jgi:hypothetical protein
VARSNPLPALVTAFGIIGVLGCSVVYSHYLIYAELYPGDMSAHRSRQPWKKEVFGWMAKNLSQDERVFAVEDSALFLATNRHSMALPTPTRFTRTPRPEDSGTCSSIAPFQHLYCPKVDRSASKRAFVAIPD